MSSAQKARRAAPAAPKTYTRDDGVLMVEVAKGRFVRLYTAYVRGLISAAEYEAVLQAEKVA